MSSNIRNIVITIIVLLLIGGVAFTRMSNTELESSDNIDDQAHNMETPTDSGTEEETENLSSSEVEEEVVEIEDPESIPEEAPEETIEDDSDWSPVSGWWDKRQVPMYSNLATVMVTGSPYPTGEYTEERYLEIIDQMGVTVMSWFDYMWKPINNNDWTDYIDLMHEKGRYVVGTDSMITTWKMGPDPPEHDASICLDPYGNKVTSNYGLSGTIGEEAVWYIHTTIHPDWQEYLLDGIKRNIDAGVDAYLIDELCYSAVLEPDFSEYSMTQFKAYLDEELTDTETNRYKNQFGLASWNDLDYPKVVRNALPNGWTQLTYDDWRDWDIQQGIPLSKHYQRFLRRENRKAAEYLIREAKQYAEERGREMPFTINVNDLSSPESLIIADLVDFLDMECTFNKFEGFYPKTRGTAPVKLSLGLGLMPNILTALETRSMIVERGATNTATLYKLMVADVTASGGNMYLEEGGHSVQVDLGSLEPYYMMPETYPELFEINSNDNEIAILHLWENLEGYLSTAYYGTCSLLSDAGFQYDVVFGAEEFTLDGEVTKYPAPNYPLSLDQITKYNLVIIPELMDVTDKHAGILLDYLEQGGSLLVFTSSSNLQMVQNQREGDSNVSTLLSYLNQGEEAVGAGRIITINQVKGRQYIESPDHPVLQDFIGMVARTGVTPSITGMTEGNIAKTMYSTSTDVVVHLVNCKYDWMQDTVKPVPDLTVDVRLPEGAVADTVTYYTPETAPVNLEHTVSEGVVTVTLPDLDVWGIIHIN